MPHFLGINYFKDASRSYHKCISEYSLAEPWHLEQQKNVCIHKHESTNHLFIQPWKKVQMNETFLLKESNDIQNFGELLGGFDPFQSATYQRLSGIVPSSLEEENVNSRCSQTFLNGSPADLVRIPSDIQPYDSNQIKIDLETGHEWLLEEPILNDYLHGLQSIELRNEIKLEKTSISISITDELHVGNDIFMFKKYHPENAPNDCSRSLVAKKKMHVKEYQKSLLPELMDEEYDKILQQFCLAVLEPQNIAGENKTQAGQYHHKTSQKGNLDDNKMEIEVNENRIKIESNTPGSADTNKPPNDRKVNDYSEIYSQNEPHYSSKDPSIEKKDETDKNDIKSVKKVDLSMNAFHGDEVNFEIKDVERICSQIATKKQAGANFCQNEVLNTMDKCKQTGSIQNPLTPPDLSPEVIKVIDQSHLTCVPVKEKLIPSYASDSISRESQDYDSNSMDILLAEFMDDEFFLDSSKSISPMSIKSNNDTTTTLTNTDKLELLDPVPKTILDTLLQSALEIKSDKNQLGITEEIEDKICSPPKKKAHTIDFRRNRCKIKAMDTKSIISMQKKISDLTSKVNCSNLLDSFVFLRTGLVPKQKKDWIQELNAKCKNTTPVEVLMETRKDSTVNTLNGNLENLTIKKEEIRKESPSHFLPVTIICSSTVLEMSELIQLLEMKFNITFIERNYERYFNCNNTTTSWAFFYADLIFDEKTSLVYCKMEDLQDSEQFMKFRQRIYHVMLKFVKCWVLLVQPSDSATPLQHSVTWRHFTKLSVWASQLSNTECEIQVKVICSTGECGSLASLIRHICDYTISNNPLWTKEQWANRSWILPEMSLHEKSLLTFPCLNSFNAQAVLGVMSITQLLTAEFQDLEKALPCISPNALKMLYAIIHWKSPINEQLSKPSQSFHKLGKINPNLSAGIFNCQLNRNEDTFQFNYTPQNCKYNEEMKGLIEKNLIPPPTMAFQDYNCRMDLLNEQLTSECGLYAEALPGNSSIPIPSLVQAQFVNHAGDWFPVYNTFKEINNKDQCLTHRSSIPESLRKHFLPSNWHPSSFLQFGNNCVLPACDKPKTQLVGDQSSWQRGNLRSMEGSNGSGSTEKKQN